MRESSVKLRRGNIRESSENLVMREHRNGILKSSEFALFAGRDDRRRYV